MKNVAHLIILITCCICASIPAQNWEWLNPLPFGDPIQKVFFVDENHGWMTPQNNTIIRTIDGGLNWEIIHTDIYFEDIHFIDRLTGWGIGRLNREGDSQFNNIYHTTDGGLAWKMQFAEARIEHDIYFIDKNYGWAVGDSLYQTKDGGNSWTKNTEIEIELADNMYGVTFLDSLNGWVLSWFKYSNRTFDGGKTWVKDSTIGGSKLIFTDSLHLWTIGRSRYLGLSDDGGTSWKKIKFTDTTASVGSRDIFALDKLNIYIASNIGLFKSNDGGYSWFLLTEQQMNSLWFINESQVWAGGINVSLPGLLYSSDGGLTWENKMKSNLNHGFYSHNVRVDFVNDSIGWLIGGSLSDERYIIKTINGGYSWIDQLRDNGLRLWNIFMFDQNNGWICGDNSLILNTSNGGKNWNQQHSGKDFPFMDIYFVDKNNGWAVGGKFDLNSGGVEGYIYNTTNGGQTWHNQTPDHLPRLFGVTFIDNLKGWVIGGGGSVYDSGIIMHTKDGGNTWEIQKQNSDLDLIGITFVDSLHGWAHGWDYISNAKVFRTTDGGNTWQSYGEYLAPTNDIYFLDKNIGYVVCDYGKVYHTEDGGVTWFQEPTYTTRRITSIDMINDSTAWIVGNNSLIMKRNKNTTNINIHGKKIKTPGEYFLIYNYPNPFNSATTIKVDVIIPGLFLELNIYDLLGRKVKTLFSGRLNQGTHIFPWNGKNDEGLDLSSGVYFYFLKSRNIIKTGKILKIK